MAYLLIVDDDHDFADTMAVTLRQAGHEVAMEYTVDSALETMTRRRPDLVILDVMFPEDISAGFGLARAMRHHQENLKTVPILILSAVNTQFPLGFSKRDIDDEWLPVSDFLEKPLELKHLVQRVSALLAKEDSPPKPGA